MQIQFNYLPEFQKDLKKLTKKIASLEADLENFKKFIVGVDFDNNKRFIILKRDNRKQIKVIKTRFMARSLKGSSKARLVFGFCVRGGQIDFIEMYLKNEKSREDEERIQKYLKMI